MTIKIWYARIGVEYGRWVPTGTSDKADAKFYMQIVYSDVRVREWMLWEVR